MPELPEVETIRRDLRRKILNKPIERVQIWFGKAVGGKQAETIDFLFKSRFVDVERRGKLLIFRLDDKPGAALLHLKMTGQLIYKEKDNIFAGGHSFSEIKTDLPNKHTQAAITFTDGSTLFFNDARRFGYIKIVNEDELKKTLAKYGIEPLQQDFTLEAFRTLIKKKKMAIKAFLLNQTLIAGIGKIYADEICHAAHIKPTRRTSTLTIRDVKNLYEETQRIIALAIEYRGTTFNNYVDSEGKTGNFSNLLNVYERTGETCRTCKKGTIQKIRVAGRGTHWCPQCQH